MQIDKDALISQDPFTDQGDDHEKKERLCCGDLRVILNYLIAE